MATDTHRELDDEARDRIALFVLDSMQVAETTRFKAHLESCTACREEVTRLAPAAADLVLAGPQSEPPSGLKERVLERVRQRRFALLPVARRSWYASGVPGVEVSRLWSDPESGRHTILLRLDAGASIPTHVHPGAEECFVVSGDLRDGDLDLGAGDYMRHDGGTEHTISTENGCLLYVTTCSPQQQPQSIPAS